GKTSAELNAIASWADAGPQEAPTPAVATVSNRADVLNTILQALAKPDKEWKPALAGTAPDEIKAFLEDRRRNRPRAVKRRVGGASGNMSYVLTGLGLDTTGHWLYHSPEFAQIQAGSTLQLLELHPTSHRL